QPPSRVWGHVGDGPGHQQAEGHLHWHNLVEVDWPIFLEQLLASLPTQAVWITIDKDVLADEDAATNWDQGALSILLDVIGQLAFKLGLDQLPEHEGGFRLGRFWRQIAGAPLLWCGVSAYVIEFITWLFVLSLAPLSLVFPA
nr:hypothetical protein [Tanacetum cinerariifolium]